MDRSGMTNRWKDPDRARRRIPLILAAGLVAAAILVSLFRDMGVVDTWKLRRTERQLRAEVENLRRENAVLKRQVEDLRTNPSVIEEEARRMGFVKEGENVIVVPPRQDARTSKPAKPEANRP
jgi:cell division protein FtsB